MYECWLAFHSSLSDLRLGKCCVNTVGLFFLTCQIYTTVFTSASSEPVGIKPSGRLKRDFPLSRACFLFLEGPNYDIIFFFPYHIPTRSSFSTMKTCTPVLLITPHTVAHFYFRKTGKQHEEVTTTVDYKL